MSRLYVKVNTDARQTEVTARGHQAVEGKILWGDKDNPKTALYFRVTWNKKEDRPIVYTETGENVTERQG